MAPIPNVVDDSAGQDIGDHLVSGLAPILGLFGEQVTTQFLSTSLGIVDTLLLAMGPIGVRTIVVSAIRITGARILRAAVGRAREDWSSAVRDLLPSTSNEVCELWTGSKVVRVKGRLPTGSIKTLIVTNEGRILSVQEAVDDGYYHLDTVDTWVKWNAADRANKPPNLSLNLLDSEHSAIKMRSLVVASLAAQGLSVGLTYLMAYRLRSSDSVFTLGFICYVIGSALLSIAIVGCGHAIQSARIDVRLRNSGIRGKADVIWLQRACEVAGQQFPPCIILNPLENPDIHVSVLDSNAEKRRGYLVLFWTLAVLSGLILQVLGTTWLHWSVSILQAMLVLFTTGLRLVARKRFARNPPSFPLPASHEAASLAVRLAWSSAADTIDADSSGSTDTWMDKLRASVAKEDNQWELVTGRLEALPPLPQNSDPQPYIGRMRLDQPPRVSFQLSTDVDGTNIGQGANAGWSTTEMEAFTKVTTLAPEFVSPDLAWVPYQLKIAIEDAAEFLRRFGHLGARWKDHNPFSDALESSQGAIVEWNTPMLRTCRHCAVHDDIPAGDLYTLSHRLQLLERGEDGVGDHPCELPDCRRSQGRSWSLPRKGYVPGLLSFWLQTLAPRHESLKKGAWKKYRYSFGMHDFIRIVGEVSDHPERQRQLLSDWLGTSIHSLKAQDAVSVQRDDDAPEQQQEQSEPVDPDANLIGLCFGMYLSYQPSTSPEHVEPPRPDTTPTDGAGSRRSLLYVPTLPHTSLATHCAQELFSLFILAIAGEITKVRGTTSRISDDDDGGSGGTRRVAVNAQLADNLEEALTLVIPAFAYHGLLPTPPADRDGDGDKDWDGDGDTSSNSSGSNGSSSNSSSNTNTNTNSAEGVVPSQQNGASTCEKVGAQQREDGAAEARHDGSARGEEEDRRVAHQDGDGSGGGEREVGGRRDDGAGGGEDGSVARQNNGSGGGEEGRVAQQGDDSPSRREGEGETRRDDGATGKEDGRVAGQEGNSGGEGGGEAGQDDTTVGEGGGKARQGDGASGAKDGKGPLQNGRPGGEGEASGGEVREENSAAGRGNGEAARQNNGTGGEGRGKTCETTAPAEKTVDGDRSTK